MTGAAARVKLSVCVATYNRASFIGETLEALAAQATDDVELVVLDGASTDGTQDVMQDFVRRYPRTVYRREETNGGLDRDFDIAVETATGEYCWLMSDDDLLLPGAIEEVLRHLAAGPDLLVVNSQIWSKDLRVLLNERQLDIATDREYGADDQHRLLGEVGAYLSFIGGVVVRRSAWLARERGAYYGSLFIHVGVLFQGPPLGRARVLARPLIRIRYGNASWSARSWDIWTRKWPQLVWSFPGLPDAAKQRVTPRLPATRAQTLLWYRAVGAYGPAEYRELRRERHHPLAATIAHVPCRLANAAVAAYVHVRAQADVRVQIYDLMRAQCASGVARWAARRLGIC